MTESFNIKSGIFEEEDFLKDCPNYDFIPTIMGAVPRIIVIGDIHGDLQLTIKSFKLADLIDDELRWIAQPPNTIVVQVGDQIDSCRPIRGVYDCHNKLQPDDRVEDMSIIDFFNTMHKKAKKHGGAVYSLFGNHEILNSQGLFDYVSYNNMFNFEYGKYKGTQGRRDAFKPGGEVANMLACTRKNILIIGSNLFVHAGILPKLISNLDYLQIEQSEKLKYLNIIVRKWLLNKLSTDHHNAKFMFIDNTDLSPFWTRVYGSIPEKADLSSNDCKIAVGEIIKVLKVGQIIVGHTPQLYTKGDGINGTCFDKHGKNKLYRVDGGFSRAFRIFQNYNLIQVLEILNDTTFRIIRDVESDEFIPGPKTDISDIEMREHVAPIFAQNRI
uniref:Calcineurin-like phosphoesterase domain-containing protein n=1 Tax=viral metagenome TaxID=1070528 RepID=A0A6C0LRC4_9ZZZZ